MLLARLLKHVIRTGDLHLVDATGKRYRFGDGTAPHACVRLHRRRLHTSLALLPTLSCGETYMDGTLTVDEGRLRDFLAIVGRNMASLESPPPLRWWLRVDNLLRRFSQANPLGTAQRHVAHHYNLSEEFYALFLDRERQYSCTYYPPGTRSLEQARRNKLRHIAAKLLLDRDGLRVLDIGSGWGGLAIYLARESGADVTGVTLSTNQHKYAQERARACGLAGRVRYHLRDYRQERGTFDRVVSIGMFEHVGVRHYREFFAKVNSLLRDDGVCLLHSIGRMAPPGTTNPWVRKYIFPGGYAPALSEVLAAVEHAGLWVTDIEILRGHYADTLHAWHEKFQANREQARRLYGERFCRMWEFYLVGSEVAFRDMDLIVFQLQPAFPK